MSISRKGADNLCQTFKNLEANKNEHSRLYPQETEEFNRIFTVLLFTVWEILAYKLNILGEILLEKKLSSLFPMETKIMNNH